MADSSVRLQSRRRAAQKATSAMHRLLTKAAPPKRTLRPCYATPRRVDPVSTVLCSKCSEPVEHLTSSLETTETRQVAVPVNVLSDAVLCTLVRRETTRGPLYYKPETVDSPAMMLGKPDALLAYYEHFAEQQRAKNTPTLPTADPTDLPNNPELITCVRPPTPPTTLDTTM